MLKLFYYNLLIITLSTLIKVTHKLIGPQRNLCSFWLILDLDGFELLIEFVCLIQSKVNIWCVFIVFLPKGSFILYDMDPEIGQF